MRVERSRTIDAPRELIWERVRDPGGYPHFVDAITRCEPKGRADPVDEGAPAARENEPGLGSRYAMRMRVGSADVGGLVEVVEFHEPGDLSWTNVTGIDQRGRWRLRETAEGRTRVTLRLSYDAPGGVLGIISDRVSAPMVGRHLERTLDNLQHEFEGGGSGVAEPGTGLTGRIGYALGSAKVLVDAGVIRPIRPDRLVKVLTTLARFGRSPAAGTISLAMRYPDETMIFDELGSLTFAEVHERTNALAHALSDAGIGEGDGVGIMCRNHRGFIEATVAVSKLGGDALYLNTAFAGPQLTDVVKREKPVALIYDEEFTELLADAGKRRKRFVAWHDSERCADPTLDELIETGDRSDVVAPGREGRVVILTSGTTGTPKGASRGNPQTLDPAVSLLSRIPLRTRQTVHIAAPLFHSWGFAHYTIGLILGSTYVLRRKFDPEACLAEVARTHAEVLVVVPVMLQRILELPEEVRRKYEVSSLKVVPVSGSALLGDLATEWMNEFGDNLYNLYGSTEVAWASIATPDDMRAAPGTAGLPPRGTILRLYDERGRPTPQGATGRIFVGNAMLFEGYTGGGSKDVIDGLMATGDVGRFDPHGRLFVEGRDDEMIVSGGENVFPAEIEDALARHPAVSEAAAIGVDDKEFGQRLRAFVVLEPDADVGEDDLKDHVKRTLARYKVPREIVFLEELPRNATGKVLKRELSDQGVTVRDRLPSPPHGE
ncbi:MAG TPA: AMP-binding protein [Thermoleophilaceae bacterium]|nr:AMP-binding protein [Thermoleophilaceae bacterium]